MANKAVAPSMNPDAMHERVKRYQTDLLAVVDPVEREILRGGLIAELKEGGVSNAARVVAAAEKALGAVSEIDRQPIPGDVLNPIRRLSDHPNMLDVSAALLLVEQGLVGISLTEREILAHRRTAITLLKARHVSATELVDKTFKPLINKSRVLPVVDNSAPRTTEQAYAEELSHRAGENIKFRPGVKTGVWFVFDGSRWVMSDNGGVIPLVTAMAKDRYRAAAESKSLDERKRFATEAAQLESLRTVENVVRMASTLPELRATGEEFDGDPYLLNVQNGTIDLRKGELRPHRREDLLTKIIPIDYDPEAACPVFMQFLSTIFEGNEELISYVRRAAGYTVTADIREQVMFIAIGTGANGKTTLMNAFQLALGPYSVKMSSTTLLQQKNGGDAARNDISTLEGCRMAVCAESGLGRRLNEEWVKELVGGEKIKAKRLYLDLFEVDPTWKIWLATNHKPTVRGTDHAIWRRLKVIPFNVTIPDEAQDKSLPEKFKAELPGILAWVIKGCLDWRKYGLMEPKVIGKAASEYRSEQDFVFAFLDECCVIEEGARATNDILYKRYLRWAKESHEPEISKKMLAERLLEKGFKAHRTDKARGWLGVRVAQPGEKDQLPEDKDRPDVLMDHSELAEALERNYDSRDYQDDGQ